MCNLSLGIEERAEARGEERGEARGMKRTNETIIINMYKNKFTLEQISLATQKSVEEIEHIIEENCVTM